MKKIAVMLLLCLFFMQVSAQVNADSDSVYVKANYQKFEYQIPMRDGKKLFTSVYVPKDQSKKYPVMMDRTPLALRLTA